MSVTMPTLSLIATGGTIAGAAASATDTTGYVAGSLPASALIAAVPQLGDVADLHAEQLFNLDSKDLGPPHWLKLARRAQAVLDDPAIDGVVITHGTDTLEETAFFLHHTLASSKAVVLTAAMRPATALSADGPMNLYDAVSVAAHTDSRGRGVLVSFGGAIYSGACVRKHHTSRLQAFSGGEAGPIGRSAPVRYFAPPADTGPHVPLSASSDDLPRVDVVYVGAGSSPDVLAAVVEAGARGVVLALPGNGSVPERWRGAIKGAVDAGIPVVRSSRAALGGVSSKADDAELGTFAANELPASLARVALMLGLASASASASRETLARLLSPRN